MYAIYVCVCVGESLANLICWMQSFDIDFFPNF